MHFVALELPRTSGQAWALQWQEEEEEAVMQVLHRWHLQMGALTDRVREWRGLGQKLVGLLEPQNWRAVQLQSMRFQG